MDEQRVREIVREELAVLIEAERPVVTLSTSLNFTDVDAVIDRFTKRMESEMSKSFTPFG